MNRKEPASTEGNDPQAMLRRPAHPPRPNVRMFFLALLGFFSWLVFLAYLAWRG